MTMERKEEMIIDMQRLVKAVANKLWLLFLAAVLGAVVFLVGTLFFITPKYESSAMFYVNNNDLSVGEASFSISSSDITASKSLVDSYIVILQTRETLNDVMDYAGVSYTVEDLLKMLSAASVNATEIFEVVVTSPDPQEAEDIADAIAYILPKRISSIIEGTSAKVVDSAVTPVKPSSPSYLINTLIGFAFGLILCGSIVVLLEVFDITIRSEEDVTQVVPYPVLTTVPDMMASSKGGYYAYADDKTKMSKAGKGKRPELVGPEISFAASEAYKLLRTKLQFSFATEKSCRIIGVSSSLAGEGKSLTSVNLAYSLSQLNKKVLLIDCDMRRPSVSVKLPIAKTPGLSNYLSGQCKITEVSQCCNIPQDEHAFAVMAAGTNPPNPVELLSSARMERMLEALRSGYDYIILDLPPVGDVSDAMAVAKLTDGMLLVVRQNYCDRLALSAAIRQFQYVEARILGVIYNFATDVAGTRGKKYYKSYYGYENAAKAVKKQHKEAPAAPKKAAAPAAEAPKATGENGIGV